MPYYIERQENNKSFILIKNGSFLQDNKKISKKYQFYPLKKSLSEICYTEPSIDELDDNVNGKIVLMYAGNNPVWKYISILKKDLIYEE